MTTPIKRTVIFSGWLLLVFCIPEVSMVLIGPLVSAHEGHLLCTLCQIFSIILMSTHTHTHKEMFCSSKLSWGLQEIKESPAATHTITIALHHFLYRAVYYQCSRWGEQSQVHSTLGSKNPKGRFCRWSKICLPETCLLGMKINLGWSFLTNRRLRMSFFLSPP